LGPCVSVLLCPSPRWHHIYLPLLPRSFADYLSAPMPFLIGLPAQLLPALKGIPMDEITLIDLDLGRPRAEGSQGRVAGVLCWSIPVCACLTRMARGLGMLSLE
jgi:hypothetical protein